MNRGVASFIISMISALATFLLVIAPSEAATINYLSQNRSNKIIVFLHGIFGDSMSTFTNGTTSWSSLVIDDRASSNGIPKLGAFDIASVQYDGGMNSRLSIQEIAIQLRSDLESSGVLGPRYNQVFVVAHSMGGLIIKRFISDMALTDDKFLRKMAAVFLISTPSQGAEAANFVNSLPVVFKDNRLLADMKTVDANTFLQLVDDQWTLLMTRRAAEMPKVFCMYETQSVPWTKVVVVPRIYANTRCSGPHRAENRDHISIVKPTGPDDPVYLWVRGEIVNFLEERHPPLPSQEPLAIKRVKLFDEESKEWSGGQWKLKELRERPNEKELVVGSAENFLMSYGFVVSGFAREIDGTINLKITTRGVHNNGQEGDAWRTTWEATHVDDWKHKLQIPIEVGAERVNSELRPGRNEIAVALSIQCAKAEELRRWSGDVIVEVEDWLLPRKAIDRKTFRVPLKRVADATPGRACDSP
ncbi:hypothetical protein [Methylobacterium sp. yr668]|uniref:esterase/lipase family protein n=1 Tax=Methylobacterium sp. yr668 TaxID=1761801 RepID=UPI0008E53473|nr:hypothetical protein [Methylobacterium sp. yr668]SFT21966.1 hypothetical protein SAMN04487845_1268 [Methylobacterium sp. yr668]